MAALNRLELVGESVRAALEALAAAHPQWLAERICVADSTRRYGTPMTGWRPSTSQAKRDELAIACARDGYRLLEAVYDQHTPRSRSLCARSPVPACGEWCEDADDQPDPQERV